MKPSLFDGTTIALGCLTSIFTLSLAFAVEADPVKAPEFIGVKECAACHSAPSPIYRQLGVTQFVQLNEASIWLNEDKHAHAYQLVRQDLSESEFSSAEHKSNLRSLDICKKLGWKVGDGNFEKQCLTCHAGLNAQTELKSEGHSMLQFGVQCESCHGPGSEYTRLENHQQVSWREKTPKVKAQHGMVDLTSASVTAEVCYSCHIGDLVQNRFVTHPMYAAGHPPLPPIDLQIFLDAMPQHWQGLQQKPYAAPNAERSSDTFVKQAEYYKAHFGEGPDSHIDAKEWRDSYHRTRRSMIGGLVANDVGIRLIHDAADKAELWGDFAIYDCAGCHHDLSKTNPRWRPLDRTPGRAYPAMWWTIDIEATAMNANEVRSATAKNFYAAFDRVPFGDRNQLVALKSSHYGELEARLVARQAIEKKPMTEKDVRAWLVELYKNRQNMLGDYWSAKQTAWMFQVAIEELITHKAIAENPCRSKLDELAKELNLRLRIDQKASVLDNQEQNLSQANSFNSKVCQRLLMELVQIVAPNENLSLNDISR